jgi:hypothetical protein
VDEDAALLTFQHYCGPTALAQLLDVTRLVAARILLPYAGRTKGSVATYGWISVLTKLGAQEMATEKPVEEVARKLQERWDRYREKMDEWDEGKRLTRPRRPRVGNHARYTVAEFLRRHPEGWIVLGISGHTLVACNGRVVGDTKRSRSMKGRVRYAYHFTEDQVTQLRKEGK